MVGLLGMVVVVGRGERLAERFLPVYRIARSVLFLLWTAISLPATMSLVAQVPPIPLLASQGSGT